LLPRGSRRDPAGVRRRYLGHLELIAREEGEEADLPNLAKGDWRKRVIGRALRRRTTVSVGWIAEKLKAEMEKRRGNRRPGGADKPEATK
jgi:hypothetical protein